MKGTISSRTIDEKLSGKEGDPVPAEKESVQQWGQGPLPYLKIDKSF
jgi:hypothetical protein